jgi:inosine-uridine nucleoside N-ribohydrolase
MRYFESSSFRVLIFVLCISLSTACAATSSRVPVVLDTDIGSDIDDAFALAMVIKIKDLDLKAVTTVSGDTRARARIAAKMLAQAKLGNIPVAAGEPDEKPAFAQAQWAKNFTSPSLVREKAVDLLKQSIDREHGKMVVIAIGPLTNVADLLKRYPDEKKQIREIVLMGGSIARGYAPGSGPTAEYNIVSDAAAAQVVFTSGVPIRMAPLDVTARLQLDETHRDTIFAHHTPLTDSLRALYILWGQPTPTLHDPMAVSLLTNPGLCQTKRMDIQINANGLTEPVSHSPGDAVVAVETIPGKFIDYYDGLFGQ